MKPSAFYVLAVIVLIAVCVGTILATPGAISTDLAYLYADAMLWERAK